LGGVFLSYAKTVVDDFVVPGFLTRSVRAAEISKLARNPKTNSLEAGSGHSIIVVDEWHVQDGFVFPRFRGSARVGCCPKWLTASDNDQGAGCRSITTD
jgi:hypothetical protein